VAVQMRMGLGGEGGDQRLSPSRPAVIKTCDAGGEYQIEFQRTAI
jgi:hypothetical protein